MQQVLFCNCALRLVDAITIIFNHKDHFSLLGSICGTIVTISCFGFCVDLWLSLKQRQPNIETDNDLIYIAIVLADGVLSIFDSVL